jgi:hypothetical protein
MRKKLLISFLCSMLFICPAVMLAVLPAYAATGIKINEVVHSGSQQIEDEDGDTQDWIELFNTTSGSISLDGMYITDNEGNLTKWQFPDISISAGGYLVVYASSKDRNDIAGNLHTNFKISSSGEPILLVDTNGTDIIDQLTLAEMASIPSDYSGGRFPNGSSTFRVFPMSTPGGPNYDPDTPPAEIFINEIMSSNGETIEFPAGSGEYPDWIELYNAGDSDVDLLNYTISDDNNTWTFTSSITISAKGYLLVWANGEDISDPPQTNFRLSASGETVTLRNSLGDILDQVDCPPLLSDESYGRYPDGEENLEYMAVPTPGAQNQSSVFPPNEDAYLLRINEIVSSNRSTIADYEGEYNDWIEIYNTSSTKTINMKNLVMGDDANKWKFPDNNNILIQPLGYLIVWASGKDTVVDLGSGQFEAHTNFNIGSSGEVITLYNTDWQTIIDSIDMPAVVRNNSYGRYPDGTITLREMDTPTPAASNVWQSTPGNAAAGNITINEVYSNSTGGLVDRDGDLTGWIELHNKGSVSVDMEGLRLSDGANVWAFPSGVTINPGEYTIVFASGKNRVGSELAASFSVSPESGANLLFLNKDNPGFTQIESVDVPALAENTSWGRYPNGTGAYQLLSIPSPGESNGAAPPVNTPPVLNPIGNKSIQEEDALTFTVSATDPDGDTLTYSASGLPSGAGFNPSTRTFTWTPALDTAGTYNIIFTVSDGRGGTDSETITITVTSAPPVNTPPVLNPIGNKSIQEEDALTFTVSATDPDGDTLTYSAAPLPSGASFNSQTGYFSWTPALDTAGTYNIIFTVSDGRGGTDSETITITVTSAPPVNTPPVLNPIGNKSIQEEDALTFTVSATDPDGDTLTYSAAPLPSGASFNSQTGYFSWTPALDTAGTYNIIFTVSDGRGGTDSETITITVTAEAGWILRLDIPYSEKTDYYSGAASCEMILNYMRNGVADLLTQQQIYEYGHQFNYAQNQTMLELDAQAIDYTLGHFDPYDEYDPNGYGDPWNAYNFMIKSFDDNQFNEYLRDIVHWMAYEVKHRGSLVAQPNTPVVLPAFGRYSNWIVVNGAATSENPIPDQNNLWDTPDFTVHGLWLTDPASSGIGRDVYVEASQLQNTYFLPLESNDWLNGKYVHVAEPPEVESTADISIYENQANFENLELVSIISKIHELKEALHSAGSDYQRRMLAAKIHIYGPALSINLDKDRNAKGRGIFFSKDDILNAVFRRSEDVPFELDWSMVFGKQLLANEEFVSAIDGSFARNFYKVKRDDIEERYYYLVPFDRFVNGQFLTYTAIIIDAENGVFEQASWVKEPERFVPVTPERAIDILTEHDPYICKHYLEPELVWAPGAVSESPFYPYWKIRTRDKVYFISQKGEVFDGSENE